ncbi:hypothetical protein [Streptomyces sp. NPDC002990]
MGHALAAGATATGEPYLVIGAPGEDVDGVVDTGSVFYLHGTGTTNVSIHQGKAGIGGEPEKGDRFGTSVAASPQHIVIGSPDEAIGTKTTSGSIQIFSHKLDATGTPDSLMFLDQDSDIISGTAETGDLFGAALSAVPYRTSAGIAPATDTIIAVGSPGEDTATAGIQDSGRVVTLRVTGAGNVTQLHDIFQGTADITGDDEAGDQFGKEVSAVSLQPGAVSTAQNLLVAVGVPGEDLGTVKDAGSIRVIPPVGAPGATDLVVEAGTAGLPGTPGTSQKVGAYFTAGASHLYVGMPDGPTRTAQSTPSPGPSCSPAPLTRCRPTRLERPAHRWIVLRCHDPVTPKAATELPAPIFGPAPLRSLRIPKGPGPKPSPAALASISRARYTNLRRCPERRPRNGQRSPCFPVGRPAPTGCLGQTTAEWSGAAAGEVAGVMRILHFPHCGSAPPVGSRSEPTGDVGSGKQKDSPMAGCTSPWS